MGKLSRFGCFAVSVSLLVGFGCAPHSPGRSGLLTSYEGLSEVRGGAERVGDELMRYDAFIIDPIEFHDDERWGLGEERRDEVSELIRTRCESVLHEAGHRVVAQPGTGVGRVRIVLTDVRGSVFLLSLHPGAKLTGAGAGSASMEGEVVDSLTGEQLLAVVRTGRGNQFELDTFDKFDDLADVIEAWADELADRLGVRVPRD